MGTIRFLTNNTAFEFDKEAGDIYFYCLFKEEIPTGYKLVGSQVIERTVWNPSEWKDVEVKQIFFKTKLNHTTHNLNCKEQFELSNGDSLKIWNLFTVGTSIPDISTYWYATLNNDCKVISIGNRDSMWKSDDGEYDAWVSRLKVKLSEVNSLTTV